MLNKKGPMGCFQTFLLGVFKCFPGFIVGVVIYSILISLVLNILKNYFDYNENVADLVIGLSMFLLAFLVLFFGITSFRIINRIIKAKRVQNKQNDT